jgi:hypothetical protein
MRPLIQSDDLEIRSEACLAFYGQLFGNDQCVHQLEKAALKPELLFRLRKAEERRAYLVSIVTAAIRDDRDSPLKAVEPNELSSVLEFYQFLSHNPEAKFRQIAKRELNRIQSQSIPLLPR